MKVFKHFWLVTKHRWKVFVLCCKCGLFWRGLVHDLSKFSPTEFLESVKYYTGKRSPISVAREAKGYSEAWLHHIGRNKHHFEYWIDFECDGFLNLPYQYAVENFCDHIAAAKTYKGKNYTNESPNLHWHKYRQNVKTSPSMIAFYDKVYDDLKTYGEQYVLNKKYLKNTYHEMVAISKK